jgi:enoyl-CoA hydratase/carnithine racemase
MKLHLLSAALFVAGLATSGAALAADPAAQTASIEARRVDKKADQFRLQRVTPGYWRVTIDNPPFNIYGPRAMPQLNAVISQIENDPDVRVVVFDSAVPGFFLTHYDFVPPLEESTSMPAGPTGLPPLPDMLVRLSRAPVVSIVSIRGRATGVGSELALASDMRFASREKAVLSQWEIGAGLVPGGGPMARLPRLMGRGRALEVLLSGNDIDGALAERYGYVNRALPDAELDAFVDKLARRISTFDKRAIADIKRLVDANSLPSNEDVGKEWDAFIGSVGRPETQQRIGRLMEFGLQTNPDVEVRLPEYTVKSGTPEK